MEQSLNIDVFCCNRDLFIFSFLCLLISLSVSLSETLQFIPETFQSKSRTSRRRKRHPAEEQRVHRAAAEGLCVSQRECVEVKVQPALSSGRKKKATPPSTFKYDHFIPPPSGFPGFRTNPFCPLLSSILASDLGNKVGINFRKHSDVK